MNGAIQAVINTQRQATPFGKRYTEFLKADLPWSIVEQVVFNIAALQQRNGILKTDRQYEYYGKQMSERQFRVNEEAIMANKSDAKILEQMAEFKDENSLDMCPEAEGWFDYILHGGFRPA